MMKTAVFTSSLRHSFARSATAVTTTSCSRSKSPVVGICCRPQTQGRVRLFSSESPKPKEEGSAGGKIVAAVAGLGALYAGGQYLDQQKAEKKKELYQLVKPPAEVTSKCYLDIAIAGEPAGRIVIGLHGTITPKTVENFEAICKGDTKVNDGGWTKTKLTYEGSTFYNIIPTFAAMAGDIDGKGGRSIFDTKLFDDENYKLPFSGPGVVGMVNEMEPNNNGSKFFIQVGPAPYLTGKHTAFGTVLDGWDVVKKIEACGQLSGQKKGVPTKQVTIVKAGVL